jgi:hypothetical protein
MNLICTDLKLNFHFSDELDVEWAGHPNWFSGLVSSYCLFKRQVFHWNHFIEWIDWNSKDLENFETLFSFSGTGVIFHVKRGYEAVVEKELISQKKVNYIPTYTWRESEGGSTRPLRMEKMMSLPLYFVTWCDWAEEKW